MVVALVLDSAWLALPVLGGDRGTQPFERERIIHHRGKSSASSEHVVGSCTELRNMQAMTMYVLLLQRLQRAAKSDSSRGFSAEASDGTRQDVAAA